MIRTVKPRKKHAQARVVQKAEVGGGSCALSLSTAVLPVVVHHATEPAHELPGEPVHAALNSLATPAPTPLGAATPTTAVQLVLKLHELLDDAQA